MPRSPYAILASDATNARLFLVGGLSRTGGSLIPFLMDGHRDFFGVPFELHLSEASDAPPTTEFFHTAPKHDVLKALLKGGLLYPLVVKGGSVRRGLADLYRRKGISAADAFDRHRFLSILGLAIDRRAINESNYLDLIVRAFMSAIGEDHEQAQFIVNHSSRAIVTGTPEIFARAKIGHYVYTRRPSLDWLASEAKKGERKHPHFRDPRYFTCLMLFKHSLDTAAAAYAERWPERYHIIDFAEAVKKPSKVIRDLHKWAGLTEPDHLFPSPTFRGRAVRPNSSFPEKNRNPGASSFELWDISANEKSRLAELQGYLEETRAGVDPADSASSHALAWMIRAFRREVGGQRAQQPLSAALQALGIAQRTLKKLFP